MLVTGTGDWLGNANPRGIFSNVGLVVYGFVGLVVYGFDGLQTQVWLCQSGWKLEARYNTISGHLSEADSSRKSWTISYTAAGS